MNNWDVFFIEAINKVNERKLQFEDQDSKRRYNSNK